MYQKYKPSITTITANESYKGETIEQKINRIVNNKEPIKDGAPLVYTDRKDGVQPAYNPRTDRFEVAVEAMDKVTQAKLAKRTPVVKMEKKEDPNEGIGKETKPGSDEGKAQGGKSPEASQ